MADALGSGPSGLYARGGSSPLARTNKEGALRVVKTAGSPYLFAD